MSEHADLTAAQRSITLEVVAGMTTKEIALARNRVVRTIEGHIRNIYRRTGASTRVELVLWAQEHTACCLTDGTDAGSFTGG